MSIEIPPGLQWLSYLAGSSWPKGDEDKLFALSKVWGASATDLENILPALHGACDAALANYTGSGADQMKSQFDQFFSGDNSIENMVKGLQQIEGSVYDCGTQTEYAKLQIIITLAIMAAEIAYALATLWGAWAVGVIEAEGAGIMRIIARTLAEKLAAQAAKVAEKPLWRLAAIEALKQGGIGMASDALAQGIEIGQGHEHDFNVEQMLVSGVSAAVSAGVATPIGHLGGKYLGGWVAGEKGMTWWKAGLVAVGSGIPAGVVGAGAGIVANGVMTGQWEFDPAALLGGVGGGLVGGVHGVLGHVQGNFMHLSGLHEEPLPLYTDNRLPPYSDGASEKTNGGPNTYSAGATDTRSDSSDHVHGQGMPNGYVRAERTPGEPLEVIQARDREEARFRESAGNDARNQASANTRPTVPADSNGGNGNGRNGIRADSNIRNGIPADSNGRNRIPAESNARENTPSNGNRNGGNSSLSTGNSNSGATQTSSQHVAMPPTRPPRVPRSSSTTNVSDGSNPFRSFADDGQAQNPFTASASGSNNPFRQPASLGEGRNDPGAGQSSTTPAIVSGNPFRRSTDPGQEPSIPAHVTSTNGDVPVRGGPDTQTAQGRNGSGPLTTAGGGAGPLRRDSGGSVDPRQEQSTPVTNGTKGNNNPFRRGAAGIDSGAGKSDDQFSRISANRRAPVARFGDRPQSERPWAAGKASEPGGSRTAPPDAGGLHTGSNAPPPRAGRSGQDLATLFEHLPHNSQISVDKATGEYVVNDCGRQTLQHVAEHFPDSGILPPPEPVGPHGMGAEDLQNRSNGTLQSFPDPEDVGDQLEQLGTGAMAAVVVSYRGPADGYGIGSHAYVLRNRGDQVMVWDPITKNEFPLRLLDSTGITATSAVVYNPATGRSEHIPGRPDTGAAHIGGTRIGSSTRTAVSEQRPPSEHESDWETVSDEDSIHSYRTTGYDETRDDASDSEDSAYRARRAAWVRGKRRVGDPVGPPDEHDIADESARTTQEEPKREIPTIEITPPDGMSDPIRDFGTRRDGSQDLNHITPVPQETVEWLHEQVFRTVEGNRGADEGFRAEVRRVLSGRLLSSEWARLLSESGMPLRVKYLGRSYPVSLRVSLRAIGPSKEQIEPLKDGPPVGIQRWAFWISDTGDNAGSSDLRAFSYAHAIRWGTGNEKLSSVTLTPEVDIVHNQLSTGVSVGATVQPMTIIRSKGRSWPFDYEMVWELRENDGPSDLVSPKPPAGEWRAATGDAPNKLLVWFPGYVSKSGETPRIDPGDASTIPAPMDRLRDDVPLHGVTTFPDHDKLLADVMASFDEHFDDISDNSAEQLREFFSEGNVRSMIPMSWDRPADSGTDGESARDGSVESPIFYTASGKPLGYLEITTDLHGGTEPTGPTTEKSVLESYVLRSLRAQGSSTIANSLGGAASLSLGFGGTHTDPATGTPSRGGQITVKGGVSQHFSHTLNYGGSARMAHSLRTGEPLLHVTPTMTVRVRLVRPDGPPIEPKTDSPMDGGRDYPIHMLVPSLETLGEAPTETRYAPSEIVHLKQLGVSTTPLRVDGVQPLLLEARQWLSDHGFFPMGRESASRLDAATMNATHAQRLNNLRKFNQLSNALGRRSALDEMIEGGTAVWFELPTPTGAERVSINLAAERRYPTPGDLYDGVEHQWTLPKVQTLNYTGSTIAGDEQFTKTPRAWKIGANGSITNPLDNTKHLWFQNLTPDYTFSKQSSKTQESTAGTGHEYYTLSPTENGTQVFTVPVTYRMQISHSHTDRHGHSHSRGAGPAPSSADGTVRLAVPTYRTTTEKPEITAEPADPIVRDLTDQDTRNLSLPSPGRTLEKGVLRIPETALLDRVGGSKVLRKTVLDLIDGIELEAAENARTDPPLPGSYPADATGGVPAAHDSAADPATERADDAAGEMSESGVDTRPRRRIPGEFPDDPEEFALPRWNTGPAFQRQSTTDGQTRPAGTTGETHDSNTARGHTDSSGTENRRRRASSRVPGEFPDGPEEYELPLWNTDTDPAIRYLRDLESGTLPPQATRDAHPSIAEDEIHRSRSHTPGEFPHDAEEPHPDPAEDRADANNTERQTHTDSMWSALGESAREMVRDGAHWAVDKATGMGRWVWRNAVGEPATNPESMAHELTHTALSPYHVNANALRTFRDSYVIEGANTPGALAGTDITVEVTGYLTDAKVLSQPPKMDGERWLQSVNGSAHTESAQRGHQTGATYTGSEGDYTSSVVGGGAYHYNTSSAKSSTTNDNSGVFRVTTEDTTPVHRFSATAHYVVTVRVGNRNFASGVLPGGMRGERTRTIEIPDAVEFLLVDNDLQNHADLLALVSAHSLMTGTDYEVPEANEPDRGLPTSFVESGKLGFGTVTDVHLEGGRNDLQDLAQELIEEHAPGATTPGTANYQPGVLTRINEHTTTLGLRTLPNAGDEGAVFHFIDRSSWLGPRLVEVKFSARPDPAEKWSEVRGKRVTATSGLDNIFGHSTGDGAALGGATRVATTQTRGHQVEGIFGGQINGHRPKFDLAVQRQSSVNEFQNSSREIRAWQSTLGSTSEFRVPYRYVVEVKSRPLDEALLTYLVHRGIDGLAATGQALGVLPPLDVSNLSTPPLRVGRNTRAAQALIRFNTSETPPDDSVLTRTNPSTYGFDPAAPGEGDAISYDVRSRLGGPPWIPSRPIEIYDFGGVGQLAQALRLVDPSLDTSGQTLANRSSEGMFIRLTTLVQSGRLTVHGPAASAPFLTAAAPEGGQHPPDPVPHTGRDHDTTTSVKFTLYSPRIEKTSKDTAIHRVEWSGDGFGAQVDNTLSTAAAFGVNVRYTGDGSQRGTFNTSITGEHADHGQSGTVTSNRRELLRFGTPMETANGGTTGHRIRALGVLEIRGPNGTLWVSGDLLLRSIETPPPETISFPPIQASADSATRPGTRGTNSRTRSSEPQQNTNESEPTDLPPNREHPDTERPEPAHDRTDAHDATDDALKTFTDALDRAFGIDFVPLPDNSARPPEALPDIPFRLT